jgi:outer membrane protein assembly factor BamB
MNFPTTPPAFPRVIDRLLFVAIHGTVLALERTTGVEVWRTALKGGEFVNLHLDGEDLFATARGEVYCLDPSTGAVRWNNKLPKLGWGLVALATAGAPSAHNTGALAEHRRRQQQGASSAAAASASAGCA